MQEEKDKKISGSAKSDFGAWGWFIVVFAFVSFMFAGNLIIDSLNITVTAFSQLRGWDAGILLSYSTVAGLIAILGCYFLSNMVSRFGVKLVYLISLLIVSGCCMVWGAVTTTRQYLLILILVNIFGNGFGFVGGTSIIANWFPRKKGLAMGWATIGFQASAVILLPVFRSLIQASGLKTAYRFIGLCLLILALICALFVKSNPEERGCNPDNDKTLSKEEYREMYEKTAAIVRESPFTTRKLLKTKQMWQIGLVNGLVQLAVSALIAQFIPMLVSIGFTSARAAMLYSAAAVIGGIGSYLWGVYDQKVGVKKATVLMCIMHAVAGIAFGLLAGGFVRGMFFAYLAALIVASILGVSSNYVGSFTVTVFGRYDYPKAFAVIYMIVCGVRSLSFATVGLLTDVTGSYAMSYFVTAVLSLIAMAMTFRIDDRCIGRQ